jgi:hypothetical protein
MAMEVLRRALGVTIAGAIGALAGTYACTLDLDRRIACGDGYTDLEAGEACDPGDPASFENACLGTPRELGTAECDPMACTVVADAETCGRCGDGIVDAVRGEECEGDFGEELCAAGGAVPCVGCLLRHDQCETCGNGVDDPGEECDPAGGSFAVPISCVELAPRFPAKPYAGGTTSTCTPLCTHDRSGCTYCGLRRRGQVRSGDPVAVSRLPDRRSVRGSQRHVRRQLPRRDRGRGSLLPAQGRAVPRSRCRVSLLLRARQSGPDGPAGVRRAGLDARRERLQVSGASHRGASVSRRAVGVVL